MREELLKLKNGDTNNKSIVPRDIHPTYLEFIQQHNGRYGFHLSECSTVLCAMVNKKKYPALTEISNADFLRVYLNSFNGSQAG
jgi:hypothetical protein